jgi:hypothetical protein
MKKKEGLTGLWIVMALLLQTGLAGAQEKEAESKKHIQLIMETDGKITELDTVIEGDRLFVWHGDTIGKDRKWITVESRQVDSDSLLKEGKKFLFISEDDETVIPEGPLNVKALAAPREISVMRTKAGGNVIDLSDPGIISYKKKKIRDGREKITIVRKEPTGEEPEMNVLIHAIKTPSDIREFHPERNNHVRIMTKKAHEENPETETEVYEFLDEEGNRVKIRKIIKNKESSIQVEETEKKKSNDER